MSPSTTSKPSCAKCGAYIEYCFCDQGSLPTRTITFPLPAPDPLARIADALERIAAALESTQ